MKIKEITDVDKPPKDLDLRRLNIGENLGEVFSLNS